MTKRAEQTLTLSLPLSDVYQRCLGAAEAVPKSKLKRADEVASKVELRTKVSLKTFGEKIELELSPEGEGATRVHVSSKAIVPTTLVDYGRNQRNVNSVVSWLRGTLAAER
jgi:hypothetical protein